MNTTRFHRNSIINSNPKALRTIIRTVADFYKLSVRKMLAPGRGPIGVCFPRQVAMSLCLDYAHPEYVCRFFGKAHNVASHAQKVVRNMRDTDATIREELSELHGLVSNRLKR